MPCGRLAEEEQGLEVGVHHRVPIRFGKLESVFAADNAGIVDQNVEPTKPLDRRLDDIVDRLDSGQVRTDQLAAPPHRVD